jgi:hypothetical protein
MTPRHQPEVFDAVHTLNRTKPTAAAAFMVTPTSPEVTLSGVPQAASGMVVDPGLAAGDCHLVLRSYRLLDDARPVLPP